jgi:hypothetical protein
MRDAKLAVETGVDGLDVVIGTSSFLREHSHGKDMAYIEKTAIEVIEYIKSKGLEVRCESSPSLSFFSRNSTPAIAEIHPWSPGQLSEMSEIPIRIASGGKACPPKRIRGSSRGCGYLGNQGGPPLLPSPCPL